MRAFHYHVLAAGCLLASLSLACTRGAADSKSRPAEETRRVVADDVKEIGKATEKAAKDIGQATVDLADKAGRHVEDVTNKAAVGSQDAWITAKVKSALTAAGLDALHVHVDTKAKVVTLSGSVDSAAHKAKAVDVAKGVTDVRAVEDHLFVETDSR